MDAQCGYVALIDDELELAADNLRDTAIKQSGSIGPERLWGWMCKHDLTQERATFVPVISRRVLNYYLSDA